MVVLSRTVIFNIRTRIFTLHMKSRVKQTGKTVMSIRIFYRKHESFNNKIKYI
jgi:hypothetical protein